MNLDLTPDQRLFRQEVAAFALAHVEPASARIDETGEFPWALVKLAGTHGLAGMTIPESWGGGGRDYVSYALAIETVARSSATLATILIVNNSLVGEVLVRFGSDAQKALWQRPRR